MAYGIDGRDEALTIAMFEGVAVLTSVIGLAAALPLTAAGIGILRTHLSRTGSGTSRSLPLLCR
jgi:hypothetical protein